MESGSHSLPILKKYASRIKKVFLQVCQQGMFMWQYVSITYTKCLFHYPRHNYVDVSLYCYSVNMMCLLEDVWVIITWIEKTLWSKNIFLCQNSYFKWRSSGGSSSFSSSFWTFTFALSNLHQSRLASLRGILNKHDTVAWGSVHTDCFDGHI